jgi:4-hydroxythreonine-4-phosphate dehydrogenase
MNGVGPEVTLKALREWRAPAGCQVVLIGPQWAFAFWMQKLGMKAVYPAAAGAANLPNDPIVILDSFQKEGEVQPGGITADAGRIAGRALDMAIALCNENNAQAMVTAPVSKKGLDLGGYHFPGQTELIADKLNTGNFAMMLLTGDFRVSPVTTHLPLKRVAQAISTERIVDKLRTLDRDLRTRFGIESPRLAVTALNPHAGEGGLLGDEEQRLIDPALVQAKALGIHAEGPFPADALFGRLDRHHYDCYVAMYHDQALIPLKMRGFGRAVNYTAGLPIIRTSPDHGTAYDIAGKNSAEPTSMVEALRLAVSLAAKS